MYDIYMTQDNGRTWDYWGSESTFEHAINQKWDLEDECDRPGMVEIRQDDCPIEL